MNQKISEIPKNKRAILEDIKKTYQIKPVISIIVIIFTTFILMWIIGAVNEFGKNLKSDYFLALNNLLIAWNLGFGLYQGIWRLYNSRKINKVLFPKLEQFINESEEESYDETEKKVYEMVKGAYADYTVKYNKLNKLYWTSIKLSFILPIITFVIWLISQKL
ncbi:hypothetical protein [Bacillus sp. AFS096315]|uniref:hypothetical protein n=1 Tax=Bacillus sp. AFS096315 TaxID=2033517 RepID=UPI000BEDFAC3|nr:hypothetical protein [Bacillus sp. AFS096315]PEC49628.1 hypothetical protein CON00_10140 [Bacillus sp. AFS096315]